MDQPLPRLRGPKEDGFPFPPLFNDEAIFLRVVHKHELSMMSGGTHVLLSFCQSLSRTLRRQEEALWARWKLMNTLGRQNHT